jgi:DNA invertase Pin-like site-specific DNA recombinase
MPLAGVISCPENPSFFSGVWRGVEAWFLRFQKTVDFWKIILDTSYSMRIVLFGVGRDGRPMRAVIYTRVSTDGQDATNQLLQLRDFAVKQGWTVVHEYMDVASGGRSDRQQLQQMFKDAARRHHDVVLVWAIDRLSREGAYAVLTYLERLAGTGVKFVSYTEPYISTIGPLGDGIIALLSCIAKMEKDRIRSRTMAGLARARAQGRVGGRPRAISDEDRSRILQLRASGLSYGKIAADTGFKRSTVHLYCSEA